MFPAISAAAKRGEALFFSERLECFHCHGGVHLTDSLVHSRKPFAEYAFHNTGLYDRDGKGAYPADNTGLLEHSGRADDMGRFRTPSLRNIELTYPYFHDGAVNTLSEAVDIMGEIQLDKKFTPEENAQIVAFLRTLTGERPKLEMPLLPNSTEKTPRSAPFKKK